jgi:hypothetical protein
MSEPEPFVVVIGNVLGLSPDVDETIVLDRAKALRSEVDRMRHELRAIGQSEEARRLSLARREHAVAQRVVEEVLKEQRSLARTRGHADGAVAVLERLKLRLIDAQRARRGEASEDDDGTGSMESTSGGPSPSGAGSV